MRSPISDAAFFRQELLLSHSQSAGLEGGRRVEISQAEKPSLKIESDLVSIIFDRLGPLFNSERVQSVEHSETDQFLTVSPTSHPDTDKQAARSQHHTPPCFVQKDKRSSGRDAFRMS